MAFAVIGLGVIVGGLILSRRAGSALIEERLGLEDMDTPAVAGRRSPLGDALDRALARGGVAADLATQLARADIKLTVGEFLAATVIVMILGGGVAYVLTRQVIAAVLACVVGFFAPRWYIAFLRGRRLRAFNSQLGDTITLMVNSLRAGFSVMQAMDAVAQEMGSPISTEFGRVVQEVQLGLTLGQALGNMLRRVPSDDLDMMITAINVQREVGGNLAEVLDSISYTIRERVRIKGEIRSLTAQSRISGYMVAMVPIVLAVVIYLIQPEFMSQLFSHRCGWIMIGVAIAGIVSGFVVIGKIVDIDV
ncbi:MAG: type II secretion system F family protein [Chloroflexota bacterium]|nr:type II secretion system F family protein [Chloroflexota bacterium]